MERVSVEEIVKSSKSLSFSFTNTKRRETVTLGQGCMMDLDGDLWGSPSGSITIIGGLSNHVHAKKDEQEDGFFMNDYQVATVHNLIYKLAMRYPHEATISDGNNDELNRLAEGVLENYRA